MFDWDDLKVFLAAARSGSLTSAAQQLGIDAATVGRRTARLESALRATLFVRSAKGLVLTAAGARLLELGLIAEEAMTSAGRAGEADVVGGTVRLSVAEGFGTAIVAPALPSFQGARRGLRIELAATAGFLSPTKREVDVAVTLSALGSPRVVVEPLTDYQLGLFASRRYLADAGPITATWELESHRLVGYVEDLIYAPELRYLDEVHSGLRPALSSSSINAQQKMIASGGGVGILPCFLAAGLVRVLPEVVLTRRFWVSTHREVASTARVRAVRNWLKTLVVEHRTLLSPGAGAN
ncbi:MAG TPA: LysR family transcriptional regulator [Caulobacteraceae bacterium]|nr:LysR family transcriptional regulator [Caulobacteraceae bacterium]